MPEVSSLHSNITSEDAVGSAYEAILIERLKRQDSNAFQDLIDLHGDSIRNLIGRLMAFDPEMEDVLQNTLVQVWRKIGSFRNQSSLRTWITRIAITQTRNHQRSVRRWMRRLQDRWRMENPGKRDSGIIERHEDPKEQIDKDIKELFNVMKDLTPRELLLARASRNEETIATLSKLQVELQTRIDEIEGLLSAVNSVDLAEKKE